MSDLKRMTMAGVIVLVLLRLSIGWQFLYEGLWKYQSLQTANPWSAQGYLRNARGPFREHFRNMAGDPDDRNWLKYGFVSAKWDRWHDEFNAHYGLDKIQANKLDELINGKPRFESVLYVIPEGVDLALRAEIDGKKVDIVTYDPKRKVLLVQERHLLPKEAERLKAMAPVVENPTEENKESNKINADFHKAVDILYARQARLSFRERLAAFLKGDPERITQIQEAHKGTIDYKYPGEIDKYKANLDRYEELLAKARQDFEQDHLDWLGREIRQQRTQLVGPVKALEAEMKSAAMKLLTPEQLRLGALSTADTPIDGVNMTTIAALIILGALLILGLASRVAALAGAGMVLSFYLVIPPWPGVPAASGPEHSLIVNKNLIEVVALLAIASLPTGMWFGLDGLLFGRRKKSQAEATPSQPETSTPQPAAVELGTPTQPAPKWQSQ